MTLTQLAELAEVDVMTLYPRMRSGMSAAEAAFAPPKLTRGAYDKVVACVRDSHQQMSVADVQAALSSRGVSLSRASVYSALSKAVCCSALSRVAHGLYAAPLPTKDAP
jgi:hypothetical protein